MKNKSITLSLSLLIAIGSTPFSKVMADETDDTTAELEIILNQAEESLPGAYGVFQDIAVLIMLERVGQKSKEASKIIDVYRQKLEELKNQISQLEKTKKELTVEVTKYENEVKSLAEQITNKTASTKKLFKDKYSINLQTETSDFKFPGTNEKIIPATVLSSTENIDTLINIDDLQNEHKEILKKIKANSLFEDEIKSIYARIVFANEKSRILIGVNQELQTSKSIRDSVLAEMKGDPIIKRTTTKLLASKPVKTVLIAGQLYYCLEIGAKLYLIYRNDHAIGNLSIVEVIKSIAIEIKDANPDGFSLDRLPNFIPDFLKN